MCKMCILKLNFFLKEVAIYAISFSLLWFYVSRLIHRREAIFIVGVEIILYIATTYDTESLNRLCGNDSMQYVKYVF